MERLEPSDDRPTVENSLADAAEALEYLRAATSPQANARGGAAKLRFGFEGDPGLIAARLRIEGVVLDGIEIFQLARLLELASAARTQILGAAARFPRLAAIAEIGRAHV